MYKIVKDVINGKVYDLNSMLTKIKSLWVENELTDEQKIELITLANENANPLNSDAPLKEQVSALFEIVEELKLEIKQLKEQEETGEDLPDEGTIYPEWYRHNGIGKNPWQDGSTCTHNNKYWLSHVDNNVWEPGALGVYDNIWEDITDKVLS